MVLLYDYPVYNYSRDKLSADPFKGAENIKKEILDKNDTGRN
jgi:hypothetical protein